MLHQQRTLLRVAVLISGLTTLLVRAEAANTTFSGTFTRDDQVRLFDVTLAAPASVDFRGFGYAGGTASTGLVISPGGIDGVLTLFDANGAFLLDNDEGKGVATDPLTGAAADPRLTLSLAAGNYILAVTQYENFARGTLLADGFVETGNPNFTASPSFATGGPCPGDMFRDITGGPGHCRSGKWTVDFVNVDNVAIRDVTVPEPGTSMLTLLAGIGLMTGLRRSRMK